MHSAWDMGAHWDHLDKEIALTPMPTEYQDATVKVTPTTAGSLRRPHRVISSDLAGRWLLRSVELLVDLTYVAPSSVAGCRNTKLCLFTLMCLFLHQIIFHSICCLPVCLQIICNDCQAHCTVAFHVLGMKCTGCGSYNTAQDGGLIQPPQQPQLVPLEEEAAGQPEVEAGQQEVEAGQQEVEAGQQEVEEEGGEPLEFEPDSDSDVWTDAENEQSAEPQ